MSSEIDTDKPIILDLNKELQTLSIKLDDGDTINESLDTITVLCRNGIKLRIF